MESRIPAFSNLLCTMSLFALSLDIAKISQVACSGFTILVFKSIFTSSRWVHSSSAHSNIPSGKRLFHMCLEFLIHSDVEGLEGKFDEDGSQEVSSKQINISELETYQIMLVPHDHL